MKKKSTLLLLLPIAALLLSGCANNYCVSKYYKDDSTYIRRNFYSEGCQKGKECDDRPSNHCGIAMEALKEQSADNVEINVYYGHEEVTSRDTGLKEALEQVCELNLRIVRTINSTEHTSISDEKDIPIENFTGDVLVKSVDYKECGKHTFYLYEFNTFTTDNFNLAETNISEGTITYSYAIDDYSDNYDLYNLLFAGFDFYWNKPIYFTVEDGIVTLS